LAKELFGLLDNPGGDDGRTSRASPLKKSLDALLAVLVNAANHAAFGNAEGSDDVGLFASALNAELGGEHAKGFEIVFVMLKDGLSAAEIKPFPVLSDDADQIADASGIFGNER